MRRRGLALFADWHVWRLFWLLDQGAYDKDAVAALRKRAEKADDDEVDVRDNALRARLFGEGHPYARSSSVRELAAIDRGALEAFRSQHYRARGATLIVVGGFDVDAMEREIRELFGLWRGDAPPARAVVPPVRPAKGPSWIGVRDPDQAQPRVTIAFATGSDAELDRPARLVLEEMIEDRVRVAREGLAATYNVDVGYASGAGGGELFVDTFVDPALLGKVLAALTAELAALRDGAGDASEDFVRARRRAFAKRLADAAGAGDLGLELDFIASNDLPVAYFGTLAEKVAAVTPADVAALAKTDLAERRMVVVVSGRAPVVTGVFTAAGITAEMLDAK